MGSWVSGLFLPRVCPGYWTSSRRGTVSAIFSTLAGWVLGPPLPCHHRLSASGIYQLHTQSVAVPLHFPKGPSLFISVPLWFGKHFHISLPLGFLFCSSVTVSLSWVTFFCPVTSLCVCVCVCVCESSLLPFPRPHCALFLWGWDPADSDTVISLSSWFPPADGQGHFQTRHLLIPPTSCSLQRWLPSPTPGKRGDKNRPGRDSAGVKDTVHRLAGVGGHQIRQLG
jgi:hypothetical protein